MMQRALLFLVFLSGSCVGHSQLDRTHIQGAASPYALSSDYRALGYNPGLLSFSGWGGDYVKTSGGFEGGLTLRSQLMDRTSMWDQVLGRTPEEESSWTAEEWLGALTDEELTFNLSFLTAAYARRFGKWAVAYANRRGVSGQVTLSSKTAKLFTDGGLDLYSEIQLVESGETVAVEDFDFSLGTAWSGVTVDANATLANLLKGTSLSFQSMRTHEIGVSRGWGDVGNGWSLHTGVGGRLLLGTAYFDVRTEGDDVVAFGARSDGFSFASLQNADSLRGTGPSAAWASVLSPSGHGWGVDAGIVLARADGLWLTASLVDIGKMTWNGQMYSVNDIDLDLSTFGSSDAAIDPDSWLSGALDVLDPDTWFQESEEATRVVSNRPMLSLGAGMRPAPPLVVAANMTLRNREALSNGGWSGGISTGIRITNAWIVEGGIQKQSDDVFRFPASTRISLENGWEVGFRLGDVSALWEGSQPEVGMQMCFLRYRLSAREEL